MTSLVSGNHKPSRNMFFETAVCQMLLKFVFHHECFNKVNIRFTELLFWKKICLLVGASDMLWTGGSAMYVCYTNPIGSTIKHQSNFLL